jgi:hypothetical protein
MLKRNSVFFLFFRESPVFLVRVMDGGKGLSVQKTLSVVQLRKMEDGLIYGNTKVIDSV